MTRERCRVRQQALRTHTAEVLRALHAEGVGIAELAAALGVEPADVERLMGDEDDG